jgi:hypothetical protein
MNRLILTSAAIALLSLSLLGLSACNKPVPANLPDEPITVPVPKSSGETGQSGDEGIQSRPKETGDHDIQTDPGKPEGDGSIITPPPVADMPPEVVPDKPLDKP